MSTQSFINQIAPDAQAAMRQHGILASLTIAQAALESGWGGHTYGANNLFGIKANGWPGRTVLISTREQAANGSYYTIKALFRAYDSWAQSVDDHALFLVKNRRYSNLIGVSDYKTVCQRIKADGYATEHDYATELVGIIEKHALWQYDRLPAQINLEAPAQGAEFAANISISGWAVGAARVDIYADYSSIHKTGLASIGNFTDRPDVNRIINPFGWYANAVKSGFGCLVPHGRLKPGSHSIDAAAIATNGNVVWTHKNIIVK